MAQIPRSFRLLDELEKGEKGFGEELMISYGLAEGNEQEMRNWTGTILGPPHSVYENRIYSLAIVCGDNYPNSPPEIKFLTRINLPCVNSETGLVEPKRFGVLRDWKVEYDLQTLLANLRREMALPHNRKLPQPAEGTSF